MLYQYFRLFLMVIVLLGSCLLYGDATDTDSDQIPAKYADSEFWHIANIGNRYDWVMQIEDTDEQIYFLERIIIDHLPSQYGGKEEGWEDSPHFNYINATLLSLLEIYEDLGRKTDALKIWKLYGKCNFGE